MMIKKALRNKLLTTAFVYTGTSVLNKSIPFILLPFLTRLLSPEEYGIISMFGILVSFATPFIGLNVGGAITRMYYDRDDIDIQVYIANCLMILIVSTSVVATVFYLGAGLIVTLTSVPEKALFLVIVIAFSDFLSQITLLLWQVQMKPLQYGAFQISHTILNMVLSLIFVIGLGMSWYGRTLGQALASVAFIPIVAIILSKNKWLSFKFNKGYIKHALSYGIPMVPHTLSAVIIGLSDRVFITNMVGLDATGVYTVGIQIGLLITILTTSFNKAYVPWLYSKLKLELMAVKEKIVKLTYAYFGIISILAIALAYLAPILLSVIVGKDYQKASAFVVWIALGFAFQGMFFMVVNYALYAQKTVILAKVSFFAAFINIVLNYFFIREYGAIGAAQATAITYFLKFVMTWILASKAYDMPWAIWAVRKG